MSRDVSPEICGWCGVEEPCGCPDRVDLLVHLDPAHDGPEDLGGFDDTDGDESDDRGTAACPDHCRGECGDPTCPYVVAWERKDGAPDPLCAECSRLRIEAGRMDARLTAAREAIRVLLGDAGLDGLGDLTTADGRSVVDIVRRGMGVAESPCPDKGRCHGCMAWCDKCGDVGAGNCDDPTCDVHRGQSGGNDGR